MVLLIVALLLVIGIVVAVVIGKVGSDSMSAPTRTSAFELPENGVRGADEIRLDQSFRGYNMAQVDAVVDALLEENAQLRAQVNPSSDA